MFTRLRDLREDHDLKQETLAAELGIRQRPIPNMSSARLPSPLPR